MSSWEASLAKAGYRLTAPRRLVMELLLESRIPLAPQTLFEMGRTRQPNLGLATVYRTLELFENLGLVHRVHLKDGCHGYVPTSPGHRHLVICEQCGGAVEFPGSEDLPELIAAVETQTGYRVAAHLLQLLGLCPACQAL